MKRVISGVPFCDCMFYSCGLVALDAMLRFYGYETPFVLHNQWFFCYQPRDNGDFQIHLRFSPFDQNLMEFGIRGVAHREPDAETAWELMTSRIDSGHPIPVVVDEYYFDSYINVGRHTKHWVILAGYDDEAETIHVVDPGPLKLFRGDVPWSVLKDAWGAIPDGYHWVEYSFFEPHWTFTAEQAVHAVQRNIRLMLYEEVRLPGTFTGLHGMRVLAEDVARWRDLNADEARKQLERLLEQLKDVAMEKESHGKCLSAMAARLDMPDLAQVGKQLKAITQKWYVFRNLCVKGQKKALERTLGKLPERLLEIVSLEERALSQLQALVGSQ